MLSGINVFITNTGAGACTSDSDINDAISKVSLYLSGSLLDESTASA